MSHNTQRQRTAAQLHAAASDARSVAAQRNGVSSIAASPARPVLSPDGADDHAVACLDALATRLRDSGFTARRVPAGRHPCLSVINRAVAQLSENIYAAPAVDGAWWLWWSWAERIGPLDDIEPVAAKITQVLSPRNNPPADSRW